MLLLQVREADWASWNVSDAAVSGEVTSLDFSFFPLLTSGTEIRQTELWKTKTNFPRPRHCGTTAPFTFVSCFALIKEELKGLVVQSETKKNLQRNIFAFKRKPPKMKEKLPTCNLVFLKFTCSQEQKEDHSGARDTDSLFHSKGGKNNKNKYAKRQKNF